MEIVVLVFWFGLVSCLFACLFLLWEDNSVTGSLLTTCTLKALDLITNTPHTKEGVVSKSY